MKTIMFSLLVMLALLFSCKPTSPKEASTQPTDSIPEQEGKPVPKEWQKLTFLVGAYLYDTILFQLPAVNDSLHLMLGSQYAEMKANWQTVSSLNRTGNILSISGCNQEDCFKNMWILMVDIANGQMNVFHFAKQQMTQFVNQKPLDLPESLEKYISNLKVSCHASQADQIIYPTRK